MTHIKHRSHNVLQEKNQRQMTELEGENICNRCHANLPKYIKNPLNSTSNKPMTQSKNRQIIWSNSSQQRKPKWVLGHMKKGSVSLTIRKMHFTTIGKYHFGRNQTFGEDGIDEGVGKQAFSHTASGSGN